MLPIIAVPLLHSSGGWIASTAAGGYVAGTLSSTWIGAFVAGNAGLLSGIGITSAAGVSAALGGALSSAGTAIGSGLTAVGLSGVAQSLGLAPATFLGLTFVSWAVVGSAVLVLSSSGIIYYLSRKKLQLVNIEREKGGLPSITWRGILEEAQQFETQAMTAILEKLAKETGGFVVRREAGAVEIKGVSYNIANLKYVVEKNGAEYIVRASKVPFRRIVLYTVTDPQK
ncbi:hypothetical protein [uncultured Marinobacter sp.]|uniref:hypothetical protein n=1 Tax=uncultured Marinobacter sp. TaxID=187379 RepID=UPI0030DABEFA